MKRAWGTWICVLFLLGSLSVAGCGDSTDESPADTNADVRRQLDDLMDGFRAALKSGDGAEGCALLMPGAQEEFAGFVQFGDPGLKGAAGTCEKGFHLLTKQDIMEDVNPKIVATEIGADKASITGRVSHLDENQTARFVKEDGEWKIATWFRGKR